VSSPTGAPDPIPSSAASIADRPSIRSIGAMLLLAIMWGLSIPATKLGLATLPPLTLTALRFGIAVPLLLVFVLGSRRLPWRSVPRVAALGILGIGIGQLAQTLGVAGTSSSAGTIISATIPIFVVVFAALRLKQAVSGRQKLGLLAAFAGIALVALDKGGGTAGLFQASAEGVAWMLLSALTIAFYFVWSVELADRYGTAVVVAWSTLFGFLALLPWAGWEVSQTPFQVTFEGVGAAAYLGLVVTCAGLFLWIHLLQTVPARIAASIQYLQPVVGVAASAVLFGEKMGALFGVGVIFVLAGLGLTMSRGKRAGA
jgi:drug/metabolite transporter (DMT)-like permease